jgi:hypothetical protein
MDADEFSSAAWEDESIENAIMNDGVNFNVSFKYKIYSNLLKLFIFIIQR